MKTVEEIAYWVDTKRAPCLLRLQPPAPPVPPAKRKLAEPDPPPSAEPCPEPRAPPRPARARPRAAAAPSSESGLFSGATGHKRSPEERAAAGDASDVSGLTASYIRSTKRPARAPAAPTRRPAERDKFLVCLNKSVNTIVDADHNLNFSNDSHILNIVSVQAGDVRDPKVDRGTSLLKFMEPRNTCGYFTRSKANSLENLAPTSGGRGRRSGRAVVEPVLVLDAARHSSSGSVNVARPTRRSRVSPAPIPNCTNFNKCFSDSDECSPRKQKFFA